MASASTIEATCGASSRLIAKVVVCGSSAQDNSNSGRTSTRVISRQFGDRTRIRSNNSKVVGSIQCTSSNTSRTGRA